MIYIQDIILAGYCQSYYIASVSGTREFRFKKLSNKEAIKTNK
jgi:hypothetical protein